MKGDLHPIFQSMRLSAKYTLAYFDKINSVNVPLEKRLMSLQKLRKETMQQFTLTLTDRFPGDGIYDVKTHIGQYSEDSFWLLNPIDGSDNILFNLPFFSLIASRFIHDECHAVCIYDPLRDDCFSAIRGRGAYLNQNRIRVSKRRSQESIIGIESTDAHHTDTPKVYRRFGCESISTGYFCSGRLDGLVLDLNPLSSALELLISESGGRSITNNDRLIIGTPQNFTWMQDTFNS